MGLGDVGFHAAGFGPWQHGQPLNIIAGNRVVRRHRGHARQPVEFLGGLLLYFVRHAGGFNFLPQLVHIALGFILLAQLFLDGLHLLTQIVFALRLLHLVLHFCLYLVAQLLDFQFLGQMVVDGLQPLCDFRRFQDFLLVLGGKKRQRRRHKIHQPARLVNVDGHRLQFIGQRGRTGHDLLE